jgi:hypothetical protein
MKQQKPSAPHSLKVSPEVYTALVERQTAELQRTGARPSFDEVLRKVLKLSEKES